MLTKLPRRTYRPAVPGQPYLPARTVCTPGAPPGPPPQPGGSWVTVCTNVQLLIGWNNGPASWNNPGPFPQPVYVNAMTCRSVWRPG